MKNKLILLAFAPLLASAAGFNDEPGAVPVAPPASAPVAPVVAPAPVQQDAPKAAPAAATPALPPPPTSSEAEALAKKSDKPEAKASADVPVPAVEELARPAPIVPAAPLVLPPQQPGVTLRATDKKDKEGRPVLAVDFDTSKMQRKPNAVTSVAGVGEVVSSPGMFVLKAKDDPSFAAEENRLIQAAPQTINLYDRAGKPATLAGGIKLVCTLAKMNFIAPDVKDFGDQIGFNITENPYKMLRSLSDHYGFVMEYKGGVWRFWRPDPGELITVTFDLKYEDLAEATITAPQLIGLGGNNNGGGGMNSGTSSSSAGGGRGNSSGSIVVKQTFLEQIQGILELPSDDLKLVEAMPSDDITNYSFKPKRQTSTVKGFARYFPLTKKLVVKGTRQQLMLVKRLISVIDVPSDQVELAVQFVQETGDDMIQQGLDATGVASTSLKLSNLQTSPYDLSAPGNPLPRQAVLSASDLSIQFNNLKKNTNTKFLERPTVFAKNNRETSFRNVRRIPYSDSTTNIASASATATSNTNFLEIGTVIKVRPRVMEADPRLGDGVGKSINLDCTITSSVQDGSVAVQGNGSTPVTNEKAYETSLTIPSGYTVLFSGFRNTQETTSDTGFWPLSEIPWVGWHLFTYTARDKVDVSLYAYMTARIVDSKDFRAARQVKTPSEAEAVRAASSGRMDWTGDFPHPDSRESRREVLMPSEVGAKSPVADVAGTTPGGSPNIRPEPVKDSGTPVLDVPEPEARRVSYENPAPAAPVVAERAPVSAPVAPVVPSEPKKPAAEPVKVSEPASPGRDVGAWDLPIR